MYNQLILNINQRIAHSLTYRGRVLDLGCGTSPYKEVILSSADEYIGVDWSGSFHDISTADVMADLNQPLPFDDEYADTVVSFQVIEHLAEPALFLSECYRVLKPSGCLYFTVPFMWHVHEAPHDYYRFTHFGLNHLLQKQGFTDIKIEPNTGFWQTWILKLNYHTARRAGRLARVFWIPIWYLGQKIAPRLDGPSPNTDETASYTVSSRKPAE